MPKVENEYEVTYTTTYNPDTLELNKESINVKGKSKREAKIKASKLIAWGYKIIKAQIKKFGV